MSKSIEVRFTWRCPHCGHQNTALTRLTGPWANAEVRLAYCDMDEGGCDNQVALRPLVTIAATVYKLIDTGHQTNEPLGRPAQAEAQEGADDYGERIPL